MPDGVPSPVHHTVAALRYPQLRLLSTGGIIYRRGTGLTLHGRRMEELSGSLHGAVLRADAVAALGRHGLRRRLDDAELVPILPRVLVDRDRALDLLTRSAATLLWAGGGVLTGETAARLQGCTAADDRVVHLLMPYDRSCRRHRGVQIHQGRHDPADVVLLDGLPILTLELVIAELLCTAPSRTALACADQSLGALPSSRRAACRARMAARIGARQDRRGTVRGARMLGLATGQPESPPESWLLLLVVGAGLPCPVSQYEVRDLGDRVLYRLDFAWPEVRVALEYDGYAAHRDRALHDAQRDADLARRGWRTVRATAADLADPGRLIAELERALSRSLRGGRDGCSRRFVGT